MTNDQWIACCALTGVWILAGSLIWLNSLTPREPRK